MHARPPAAGTGASLEWSVPRAIMQGLIRTRSSHLLRSPLTQPACSKSYGEHIARGFIFS